MLRIIRKNGLGGKAASKVGARIPVLGRGRRICLRNFVKGGGGTIEMRLKSGRNGTCRVPKIQGEQEDACR